MLRQSFAAQITAQKLSLLRRATFLAPMTIYCRKPSCSYCVWSALPFNLFLFALVYVFFNILRSFFCYVASCIVCASHLSVARIRVDVVILLTCAFFVSGEKSNTTEIGKMLQLILGCAMNCLDKESEF